MYPLLLLCIQSNICPGHCLATGELVVFPPAKKPRNVRNAANWGLVKRSRDDQVSLYVQVPRCGLGVSLKIMTTDE